MEEAGGRKTQTSETGREQRVRRGERHLDQTRDFVEVSKVNGDGRLMFLNTLCQNNRITVRKEENKHFLCLRQAGGRHFPAYGGWREGGVGALRPAVASAQAQDEGRAHVVVVG